MSLFNESWRKLRLLFEEEDGAASGAAPAERPAQAAAVSSAALRAEARRQRKADMRERLAAMMQPDGSVQGGIVKFVNLFTIQAHVGDRWPILFPKVEMMSESIIRRELDADDLWAVHSDKGFALIFTDPELTDEQANERCIHIFDAIREHLIGKVHLARGSFDVDPRIMLRALDEDGEPPFRLEDPVPPGAWVPPASALAARAVYQPPAGGAGATSQKAYVPPTGTPVAADAAPIDWTPMPDRPERDIAVGRSEDRAGGAIEVGRSDDKASHEPEWVYATVEQQRAAIADWGGQYDEPLEFDYGRTRDKRIAELVIQTGESHEEAVARYVTMGRFNTMFDAIDIRFRGFWSPRHQAVTTYLGNARLRADDIEADQAVLVQRADEVAALAALDIAVLARTLDAVVPRLEAGARFLFALPVAYSTLLRRSDRETYFDRWAALPEAIRRFGRFACYQSMSEIGDAALSEVVGMLTRAGRTPIFAAPLAATTLDRARDLRIRAISLPGDALGDDHAVDTARTVAKIAHRYGIATLFERVPPAARHRLLDADASLIEGDRLPNADALPRRPATLAADAFAAC
jgi:hypothetical protein